MMKLKLIASMGGCQAKFGCPERGRVIPDSTIMNKGREGVKIPEKFCLHTSWMTPNDKLRV